jgi:hypothetical protein
MEGRSEGDLRHAKIGEWSDHFSPTPQTPPPLPRRQHSRKTNFLSLIVGTVLSWGIDTVSEYCYNKTVDESNRVFVAAIKKDIPEYAEKLKLATSQLNVLIEHLYGAQPPVTFSVP